MNQESAYASPHDFNDLTVQHNMPDLPIVIAQSWKSPMRPWAGALWPERDDHSSDEQFVGCSARRRVRRPCRQVLA